MPEKGLALALAGLLTAAIPADAAEPTRSRLEQRASERGPIRRHLEAALSSPAAEMTAQALEVGRKQAQGAASPARSSSVSWTVGVLIALGCIVALLAEWGRGWSKM